MYIKFRFEIKHTLINVYFTHNYTCIYYNVIVPLIQEATYDTEVPCGSYVCVYSAHAAIMVLQGMMSHCNSRMRLN